MRQAAQICFLRCAAWLQPSRLHESGHGTRSVEPRREVGLGIRSTKPALAGVTRDEQSLGHAGSLTSGFQYIQYVLLDSAPVSGWHLFASAWATVPAMCVRFFPAANLCTACHRWHNVFSASLRQFLTQSLWGIALRQVHVTTLAPKICRDIPKHHSTSTGWTVKQLRW